jgi:2-polyprenyl-3-methyl-5-hydroxy-6-metoxy-1,4-benzoquinol methylase
MNDKALANRYSRVAVDWAARMDKLGYFGAYRGLSGIALDHVQRPRSLCDIGCGSGAFALAFAQVYGGIIPTLTLVDPSQRMLDAAMMALAPVSHALDIQRTTLAGATGRYDMVLAAHVIEHCPDMPAALAQLATLIRPNGHVLLVVSRPHWCQWLIWPLWRHRWFTPDQLIAAGRDAGLTHLLTHNFAAGPPSRTSLGYLFMQPPTPKDIPC